MDPATKAAHAARNALVNARMLCREAVDRRPDRDSTRAALKSAIVEVSSALMDLEEGMQDDGLERAWALETQRVLPGFGVAA